MHLLLTHDILIVETDILRVKLVNDRLVQGVRGRWSCADRHLEGHEGAFRWNRSERVDCYVYEVMMGSDNALYVSDPSAREVSMVFAWHGL